MNPKQNAFLKAYVVTGANVAAAARAAHVGRRTVYDWQADEAFAAALKEAHEEAVERLEEEATRRAHEGVHEPVIYQGRLCFAERRNASGEVVCRNHVDRETGEVTKVPIMDPLYIRKPSDNLMMFLLKRHRPDQYRDNAKVEHTGAGGAPIAVTVEFVKPNA
jgi:hypothetical protein